MLRGSMPGRKNIFFLIAGWPFCCILFLESCSPRQTLPEAELKYGPHPPVIERFYCSTTIRSGDALKFYVSAKDEDADLAYLHITVRQMGVGEESVPYIGVRKDNRARVSGYIYMFTPPTVLFGETINISVAVLDQAGHRSNTVSQDVYFGDKPPRERPPGWGKECDHDLGFIPVFLHPLQDRGAIRNLGIP